MIDRSRCQFRVQLCSSTFSWKPHVERHLHSHHDGRAALRQHLGRPDQDRLHDAGLSSSGRLDRHRRCRRPAARRPRWKALVLDGRAFRAGYHAGAERPARPNSGAIGAVNRDVTGRAPLARRPRLRPAGAVARRRAARAPRARQGGRGSASALPWSSCYISNSCFEIHTRARFCLPSHA